MRKQARGIAAARSIVTATIRGRNFDNAADDTRGEPYALVRVADSRQIATKATRDRTGRNPAFMGSFRAAIVLVNPNHAAITLKAIVAYMTKGEDGLRVRV